MTDRRAELLAQIRSATDDHPYQVYADFLEQEGDQPRAMLIRLQCELARLARWEPRHREARWEAEALVAEHGPRWRAELPALDGVEWTDFERGFVAAVRVRHVEALYRQALAIAAAAPVFRVELARIDERHAHPPEAGIPWLRCVRLAGAVEAHFDPNRSLLALPPELEIRALDEYQQAAALLDAALRGRTTPLVRLDVTGDHTAGAGLARRLGEVGPALRHLVLGTQFVDEDTGYFHDPTLRLEGARALAGHRFERLETLDLERQRVNAAGLEVVVDSLPRLRELDARASEIVELGFLARSHGVSITALDLGENPFGDAGAAAIACAPRLAQLRSLELDMCEITGAGVGPLVEAPFWPVLRHLDLARNPLGLDGAIALAGAAHPVRLASLRLADIDASREACDVLADIAWLSQLVAVDLSRNRLAGSRALVATIAAGSARAVSLVHTELDASGAAALAPLFPRIRHLALGKNPIGDAGLRALVADSGESIETLDLRVCGLGDASAALLASMRWPRLRSLVLSGNALSRDGVATLIRSPLMTRLERLDLADCHLGDPAVALLTATPALAGLRRLNLAGMRLSERSVIAIARSPHLRAIPYIRFTANSWEFARSTRDELERRFGNGWQYYADDDDDRIM